MRLRRLMLALASAAWLWPAAGGSDMTLTLSSPAFEAGSEMPMKHTCEGEGISPALGWSGAPAGTKSFALIVDDPDAPDPRAPRRTWVHWVLYDLPPGATGLAEGVAPQALPAGTRQGANDWNKTGWGPPCPPVGRHRYVFKLFALDTLLPDLGQPGSAELQRAMFGHILERTELVASYKKLSR